MLAHCSTRPTHAFEGEEEKNPSLQAAFYRKECALANCGTNEVPPHGAATKQNESNVSTHASRLVEPGEEYNQNRSRRAARREAAIREQIPV